MEETKPTERLEYLCYRCYLCGRLLTKLEIYERWKEAEETYALFGTTTTGICPCGSSKIAPGNPTPEEDEELGSQEQKARYDAGIRDHKTRLWELWDKEVNGKDLGSLYTPKEDK